MNPRRDNMWGLIGGHPPSHSPSNNVPMKGDTELQKCYIVLYFRMIFICLLWFV